MAAQEGPPVGILRGELLKWDPAGRFTLGSRDQGAHQCTFDDKTYLSRKGSKILPGEIEVGNVVEVVADRRGDPGRCHALTIYVLATPPAQPYVDYRRALERQRHLLDHILPRGKLTFAGVVLRCDSGRLVLKTRSQGRKTIRLRDDTRYTADGREADASMLEFNARVFVRAGTGLDGELEAYQVIRGQILNPR
jgi:hypothetical protein